ncbi:hypothetical protein MCACP_01470 [Neomoorella carbonis]
MGNAAGLRRFLRIFRRVDTVDQFKSTCLFLLLYPQGEKRMRSQKSRPERSSGRLASDQALGTPGPGSLRHGFWMLFRQADQLFRMFLHPFGILRLAGHAALDGGPGHGRCHRWCHPQVEGFRHDEIR